MSIRIRPVANNFNHSDDEDDIPDLVPSKPQINISKIIATNYDKIIELLDDENYDDIVDILYSTRDNSWRIFFPLSSYCLEKDDQELLIKLLSIQIYHKRNYISMSDIFKYDYLKKLLNILDNIDSHPYIFAFFQYDIGDNIDMLKLLLEHNYKIHDSYIYDVIENNYSIITKYLFDNDYGDRVQNVIEKNNGIYAKLETLKILIHYNIDFTKILNDMYMIMVENEQIDCMKLLMSVCPCEDVNFFLEYCGYDLNSMKYFVSIGADISLIKHERIIEFGMSVIKFLISCGYRADEKLMNDILKNKFIYIDVDDIIYLLDNGADINCIFEIKNVVTELIFRNSIAKIKYLMDTYYDIMQPYINDMVIMACANGRNDILKYLHAFGIELDNILIIISCYFGHLDTLKILLGLGMELGDVDEDLFLILRDGQYNVGYSYINLIDKHIKANYKSFNYGWKHFEILELLMEYKVPVCNFEEIFYSYKGLFYNEKFIKYCLDAGMNINQYVLLEKCLVHVKYDLIKLLLDMRADVKFGDNYYGCVNGNPRMKQLFADYGYEF